jgi:hypothetical protein
MSAIQFVENYSDLSTNRGYQFKFHCDRCGNGYLSSFEGSTLGMASGLLSAASSIFGGVLGRAAESTYEVQQAIGGQAHDSALQKAVAEIKQQFKQCHRCGKWVCPEVCWNATRQLCLGCAPELNQEIAAAEAQAQKVQVATKVAEIDLVGKVDGSQVASAACAKCGASVGGARFCPECGTPVNVQVACAQCSAQISSAAKFCPACGARRT